MKNNLPYLKIIKIAFGAGIAILIAQSIGLHYSVSAGIITILSIQNTKKETISVALKRLISFVIAVVVAWCIFNLIGYTPLSFGIFLLIFVGISTLTSLFDCVPVNAVLVTHFLTEKSMDLKWIGNEAILLFVGAGIGIILNLYIPRSKKQIKKAQKDIDNKMKSIINDLGSILIKEDKVKKDLEYFQVINNTLKLASKKAYENMNNTFIGDTKYYIDYIIMRKNQTIILKKIYDEIYLLDYVPSQCYKVSELVIKIGYNYYEYNNVKDLLKELNDVKIFMKNEDLPTSREEFETRAILFGILKDLESFLELKAKFVKNLTNEQIKTYWTS